MSITKQFYRYVSQNVMGMIGISCYIIVDTFFISYVAGANGITVLNLVLPIFNLIFAIGSMVGVGSSIRYSILKAQGKEEAKYYFSNAILCVCIISIPFVLAGLFFPGGLIRIMGGDEVITAMGRGYARIVLMFTPFFMCNHVVSAFVRNDNDPTRAMVGTIGGSLFNIIFDYIFMFPMGMGLTGAALATAASPVCSMLICGTHFLSKKNEVEFIPKRVSIRRFIESCRLGTAAFIGEMASGITTMVFNFLMLSIAGNIGVAAYGVIANYALIVTAVFNGVSQGAQPLISRCFGLGDDKSVKKLKRMGVQTSIALFVIIYIIIFVGADGLIALFNSEGTKQLARYAHSGMIIYFAGYVFAGFNIFMAGYFSATQKAMQSFICSILRGIILLVVLAVIFARIFGMNGVWISFPVTEFITSVVCIGILIQERSKIWLTHHQ
ncbi:MAG: MATE family efflux transporter [Lachnospira sp.]